MYSITVTAHQKKRVSPMGTLQLTEDANVPVTFGRRKVAPRACVADGKSHIRNFLREQLDESPG